MSRGSLETRLERLEARAPRQDDPRLLAARQAARVARFGACTSEPGAYMQTYEQADQLGRVVTTMFLEGSDLVYQVVGVDLWALI